jgi:hypothetical protein
VHDEPQPTPEEDERAPEELAEHQAMQYPAHEDPPEIEEADQQAEPPTPS